MLRHPILVRLLAAVITCGCLSTSWGTTLKVYEGPKSNLWNVEETRRVVGEIELSSSSSVTLPEGEDRYVELPLAGLEGEELKQAVRKTCVRGMRGVSLRGNRGDIGAMLSAFGGCGLISSLSLRGVRVRHSQLQGLRDFPALQVLDLADTMISDEELKTLVSLPHLEKLNLSGTRVSDAGVTWLQDAAELKVLNLAYTNIGDRGLCGIAGSPRLEELDLWGTSISDAGLDCLKWAHALKVLGLSQTRITDVGVARLTGLSALEVLNLNLTSITGGGLSPLGRLNFLRVLDLSYTNVSDKALVSLDNFKNLQILELQHTRVTNVGLSHLRSLKNLKYLDLRNIVLTRATFDLLRELPSLRHICVDSIYRGRLSKLLPGVQDVPKRHWRLSYATNEQERSIRSAIAAGDAGQREEALQKAAHALSSPVTVEQLRDIARLYGRLGESRRAFEAWKDLAKRQTEDITVLIEAANAAVSAGEREFALAVLSRIKSANLEDFKQRRQVALIYQSCGDYLHACPLLEEVARHSPMRAIAIMDQGTCRYLAGAFEAAEADLESALSLDPRLLSAYLTLGSLYVRRGSYSRAAALYDRGLAIASSPDNAPLRALLFESRRTLPLK